MSKSRGEKFKPGDEVRVCSVTFNPYGIGAANPNYTDKLGMLGRVTGSQSTGNGAVYYVQFPDETSPVGCYEWRLCRTLGAELLRDNDQCSNAMIT